MYCIIIIALNKKVYFFVCWEVRSHKIIAVLRFDFKLKVKGQAQGLG